MRTGLFKGVELFTIDNVIFTAAASGAESDCASIELSAATNKAKGKTSCYSKAVANGVPVDDACLQKADDKFAKDFAKGAKKNDCATDIDAGTVEAAVDQFTIDLNNAVNGSAPGPDVCSSKKIAAGGKKSVDFGKCFSTAAKKGTAVDETCLQKASDKFVSSLKKCTTADQIAPVETVVDNFARNLFRAATVVTTTTTTTTTSTHHHGAAVACTTPSPARRARGTAGPGSRPAVRPSRATSSPTSSRRRH